ncbi:TPA: hypothetical protein NJZ31_003270 [Vibrio parahaemolyticus]|nr:hypothetical protein [Vibrio parahaemolyticus]
MESALNSFLWHGEIYLNHEHKLAEHEQKQDNAIRAVIADIEIGAINKNKLQLISKDGRQVGRNSYWKVKCRICGDEKHCLPSSFLAEPCENLCDYLKRINNK